jgi:FkbM family methyltransferase
MSDFKTRMSRSLLKRLIPRMPLFSLRLTSAAMGLHSVTLRLPQTSPLYAAPGGEMVELPLDGAISPYVFEHKQWQEEELDFFASHMPSAACALVDVGANIGLITRQLLHRLPAIEAALCFEPHPDNFRMLRCNLAHLPRAHLIPAAIGPEAGELKFYEDAGNAGNYSLNPDAMRGRAYRTSSVRCLQVSETLLLDLLPAAQRDLPLLWKSDTQGHDETIMCALPDSFWSRVHAGVMEMWRIERPSFDRNRLAQILSGFPVRRFGSDMQRNLSVEQILEYSAGNDYGYADLFFAKG